MTGKFSDYGVRCTKNSKAAFAWRPAWIVLHSIHEALASATIITTPRSIPT